MQREHVLRVLGDNRCELRERFGVASLDLFGSVARGEDHGCSDVDLLVEFSRPTGYFGLFALQDYLEQLLGCAVDIGTRDSLKPRIRDRVLPECLHVA